MGIDTIMAKQLFRTKGKGVRVVSGDFWNVNPYIEWTKWLSYVPDFLKEKIEIISNKQASEITEAEYNLLNKFKEDQKMARLFKIYGTKEITEDEYITVYKYMKTKNIESLMTSKLTKDELMKAKEQIKYYVGIPAEELSEKVKSEQKQENYDKLSMIDSYVLHMISQTNHYRSMNNLEKEINFQKQENYNMRTLSYERAKKV